jgi:hypothetical protein
MNSFDTHRVLNQTQPFADEPETVATLSVVLSEDARDLPGAAQAAADIATALRSGDLESPRAICDRASRNSGRRRSVKTLGIGGGRRGLRTDGFSSPGAYSVPTTSPEISTRLVERTRPLA